MNVPSSSFYKKISSTRGKGESSGWTAFDVQQRQKQGLVTDTRDDPFPPMPNSVPSLRPHTNVIKSNDLSAGSFSSVLNPSCNFPALKQNKDYIKPIDTGKPIENDRNKAVEVNNNDLALKKLKELHPWADDSLIEDILLAAAHNIYEASALLKGMEPNSGTKDLEETKGNDTSSAIADFPGNANSDTSFPSGKAADLVGQSSKADERAANLENLTDVHENKLFDDASNMKLILGHLKSIPFEPEREEEEDVYLSHRRDAIRMMRSASQHSRAATNAFLRGNHLAAQQHSQSAQEEWLAAQRLNAKAASEILRIRNSESDLWKLDLHGLHAAEAVQALQEHLKRLETHLPASRSVSPNKFKEDNRIVCSPSVETFSSMYKLDKQQTSSRQRPASLQVITGVGNHSRGQAAIPAAVRSFLTENGYRFDETRPGLIAVRPKFRRG